MRYKGIVLAGGTGSRLSPVSKSVNKHLLPIYDKPAIYYSLSILFLSKIKDIVIICNDQDLKHFKNLLGDGDRFGVNFHYKIQKKPTGIPNALIIAEEFIKDSKVALILGDNFFYGHQLTRKFVLTKKKNLDCTVFLYPVENPKDYGILELNKSNKIKSIKEKPNNSKSNLAITGYYLFDKKALGYAKKLKPSKRKETEITFLIKKYLTNNKLKFEYLGRGCTWLDTGTFDNLNNASLFVKNIQKRQGNSIACLEEISLNNGWIKKNYLKKSIKFYGKCEYSQYLKNLMRKI